MIFEDWIYLSLIIILVIVSGFFSGSETAITAVSKARIYTKIKQGNKKAKFVEKSPWFEFLGIVNINFEKSSLENSS